jgi:hypothetical protein
MGTFAAMATARIGLLAAGVLASLLAVASSAAEGVVLLCESSEVAIAGYYNGTVGESQTAAKRSTALLRQPNTSQWRIEMEEAGARIIRFSGTTQTIEEPEQWSVAPGPLRSGFVLLPIGKPAGHSPETITITRKTLHFVYSSQHVNAFRNAANIWVGQCRIAP